MSLSGRSLARRIIRFSGGGSWERSTAVAVCALPAAPVLIAIALTETVLGILGRDGAFSEYLTLPTKNLQLVPDEVDDEAAVFCEPLAACYEVFEQRPDLAREPVLGLGDGRLGLLQAQVLRAAGAEVTVLGRHPRKLAILDGLGIRTSIDPDEVRSFREGRWPAVVEATGSAGGFELALSLTAPRGVMVLKSTVAGPSTVDFTPLVIDEITVIGSRCGLFPPALSALAMGKIRTYPLIDARFPLSEAPRALDRAGAKGTLKVFVAP